MGLRRLSREYALQILYAVDVCKLESEDAQKSFWKDRKSGKKVLEFATTLVEGTLKNLPEIDSLISKYARNWDIHRMASIDRNILRQATFEILYLLDIPINVIINEAVELAKKYSTEESGKFVNGILDKIRESRSVKDLKE
ncbi:transcription antitermination factor NusB [bacterium]|nr:transcription antitermination factor NusB [bacterium]NIN92148.1 transcription antitermination factor NusB [bacterium]NIO18806.1 transcription antitermination factor NusB [bacterium]NIO73890.1 transcription antitermination factor NusB [bacterium]